MDCSGKAPSRDLADHLLSRSSLLSVPTFAGAPFQSHSQFRSTTLNKSKGNDEFQSFLSPAPSSSANWAAQFASEQDEDLSPTYNPETESLMARRSLSVSPSPSPTASNPSCSPSSAPSPSSSYSQSCNCSNDPLKPSNWTPPSSAHVLLPTQDEAATIQEGARTKDWVDKQSYPMTLIPPVHAEWDFDRLFGERRRWFGGVRVPGDHFTVESSDTSGHEEAEEYKEVYEQMRKTAMCRLDMVVGHLQK